MIHLIRDVAETPHRGDAVLLKHPSPEAFVTETGDTPGGQPESPAPNSISKYELLTKFATGGMAELYLARERGVGGLERVVVIKRLLPHLADDPSSVDMFLREARLVARLNHPNVVQTYELGEEGGDYFLAMEYLHGSTLRELESLAEDKRDGIPLPIAVSVIEQASRGLHAAHELRDFEGNLVELIHRDVSPQNLMCTAEGYVKLLDFGVAKAAEGKEATYSGNIKGKFSYMSPEQLEREQLDRRSDLFALGIVTWELLTGQRLFDRDGELETMRAITKEEAEPPGSINPDIPEEIDRIVLKALEKSRRDRYESVEEFRLELSEVAEAHDLLRDENRLAEFVDEVAGEQLEARRETLQEALERSLTADERATLRHEEGLRGMTPTPSEDRTSVQRPSVDRAPMGLMRDSSVTATGENDPTRVERPGSDPTPSNVTPGSHPGTSFPETSSPTKSDMAARWQIGLVTAAVILLAASGILVFWGGGGDSDGQSNSGSPLTASPEVSGKPLTFGIPPIATEEVLRKDYQPIEFHLERATGRPIEIIISESYVETSRELRAGKLDLALITPLLFIRTRRAEPDVQPLAVREFDGAVTSDGLLLVLGESDIQTLEDLRDKVFCLTDKNSTTGNFLPRVLIRRRGWDPQTFIGRVHWSGNHLQVLRDLVAGKCDAAATYSGSFLTADEHGVPVGRFRTLAITGHTPSDTLTARPGLSRDLVEELQSALVTFDSQKHAGKKAVGKTFQITGFQKPREELYKDLAAAVDEHGDILVRFGFPGLEEDSGGTADAADTSDTADAADTTD